MYLLLIFNTSQLAHMSISLQKNQLIITSSIKKNFLTKLDFLSSYPYNPYIKLIYIIHFLILLCTYLKHNCRYN